ncbi:secretion/conjugation apparatus DotM-related subunit [Acetobacter conturbans]|uniref:DotM C-terminal cytoplasmic domain-containing protein n=1 Tax=Acetobacter conturbans TaxID=1737472 RepID=A0ABX0K5U9_9PROT|nr:hypothetical protein [Acetobacter conturbans]NHN89980.1 hypothetical protein [Acetobacter conturbans]
MSATHSRSSGMDGFFDNGAVLAAVFLIVNALLFWIAWSTWHAQISLFVMRSLLWQIGHLTPSPALNHLAGQLQHACRHPSTIRLIQLYYGISIVGVAIRWPAICLTLACAMVCILRGENRELRRVLNLDSFIEIQARMFPTLRGFAKRRLTALVPPSAHGDPRPADPALTSEEWVARYARNDDGSFNEVGASEAFSRQVGASFSGGPEDAAPVARVLFAAFALHRLQRRKEAMELLGALSEAMADIEIAGEYGPASPLPAPKAVVREADRLLASPEITEAIATSCEPHGWTTTALMSLLCDARLAAGVLAPPAFAIVKLIDRPLWYALHSLGFPSENPREDVHPNPRIEAAGARAHWEEERRLGRPLYLPALDRALATVRPAA